MSQSRNPVVSRTDRSKECPDGLGPFTKVVELEKFYEIDVLWAQIAFLVREIWASKVSALRASTACTTALAACTLTATSRNQ